MTGARRYYLGRNVVLPLGARDRGTLLWVMLNPSIADDTLDDQTIRRVKHYTSREQYGRAFVVNLLSQRATIPADLDPIDPDEFDANLRYVAVAIVQTDALVAAWGATNPRQVAEALTVAKERVSAAALAANRAVLCLGTTANGEPRHPSRLGNDTALIPYEVAS